MCVTDIYIPNDWETQGVPVHVYGDPIRFRGYFTSNFAL